MYKHNRKSISLLPGLILSATLIMGISACSDSDDDDMDSASSTSQETMNPDGSSTFITPLSPKQEVPPLQDNATAQGEGNLTIARSGSGAISGSVSVSGLTGPATAAHIHRGFGGTNGGVELALTGNEDGTLLSVPDGSVLTPEQLTALAEGELYINVHTAANPGGEVRGQIIPDGILFQSAELSGEQEVPPVTTEARGTGTSTVNSASGSISATIITTGLDDATMAHIHMGSAGENGDFIITLERDPVNPGIWRAPENSMLSTQQIEMFTNKALYFNVHSDDNPAGEIRGQL
ncbi:MAG: CHRD domain-containing protein [Granulosicoccus sp.]